MDSMHNYSKALEGLVVEILHSYLIVLDLVNHQLTNLFLQPAEADAVLFLVCLSVRPLKIIDFISTGPLDLFRMHFE